jgi:tripartite-type tricarboxylate transporter receptor subunit TctC
MNPVSRRRVLAGIAAWVAASPAVHAQGEEFPSKPIRLVVPFAPGGLNDVLARQIAELAKTELRQPVLVDNKPGASGHIGADLVAKAVPDGHTLVMLATLHAAGQSYNADVVRYDLFADFAPVAAMGNSPAMLVARKDLNLRNMAELVAAAKARPGQISFAAVGAYLGEFMESVADIDLNLVLYRGAAAATNDLLGQNIDLMTGTASDMMQLVRSGKFVPLGVSGNTVLADAPQARPITETLPDYRGGQTYGLFAPVRTPAPALARLRSAFSRAAQSPEYRARLQALYVAAPELDPDGLLNDLRASAAAFARARAKAAARKS